MKQPKWKYIFASETGTSHKKASLPCQDSSYCEEILTKDNSSVLVAIVSDGAGSAIKADVGSKLACRLFAKEIKSFFETGRCINDVTLEFIQEFILYFQDASSMLAKEEGFTSRDFACTFLAAIVGESSAVFVQVGDGAIVISSEENLNDYSCVFWPQQGEYANMTNFITDANVLNNIEYKFFTHQIKKLAVFTDGIQHLALHYQTQTAHSPFFRSMFNWLSKEPIGFSQELANSLAIFLNSQKVIDITDDDKTLILCLDSN